MTNCMMIQTQGLSSSSMRIEEETMLMMQKKNQGIVTILGNSEGCWDTYTTASASSPLRKTLSADMSSKKWLSHHNMSSSPMKKIASSEELTPKTIANSFSSSSSSSSEEDYEERKDEFDDAEAERERLEIWSSIQRNKKEEIEKSSSGSGPFDTWSSIMSLKGNEISKSLPLTPYVHPLVKRSKSSLSEKSLEICTESLGSESGSDGCLFPYYPPSELEDNNKGTEQQQQQQQQEGAYEAEEEEYWYNNHAMTHKKSPSRRSFPPPLPSLSLQANQKGPSLHMRPHRDNGRLVLEAVSLPSQNNFNARRQDGRLVLTFTNDAAADDDEVVEENYYDDDEGVEEFEEEFGGFEEDEGDYYYEGECGDEDDDEEEEEEEGVIEGSEVVEVGDVESVVMEEAAPLLSSGVTSSVHRLALMMKNHNKPIGLVNRNPNWSEKFNKGVNLEDVSVVEMEPSSMVQSLPQRVARLIPSAASASAAASFNFNAHEYYWKTKPTSESDDKVHNPLAYHQQNNNYSPHKTNYGSKVIFSGDMNQGVSNEQQQLLVLRGKNGDYLVHNLKSCKDSRRPFLFWEPYCIATS